jgi:hypothetical protein
MLFAHLATNIHDPGLSQQQGYLTTTLKQSNRSCPLVVWCTQTTDHSLLWTLYFE